MGGKKKKNPSTWFDLAKNDILLGVLTVSPMLSNTYVNFTDLFASCFRVIFVACGFYV